MRNKFHLNSGLVLSITILVCLSSVCWAVSSKITHHSSQTDLLKGRTSDVVIGSKGTIQLAKAAEVLAEELEDAWSINSIVVSGGTVFVGTSPNGGIFKYSLGKLTRIYPSQLQSKNSGQNGAEPNGVSEQAPDLIEDVNTPVKGQYLANEHVFAMATDVAGRLLAGISGEKCVLYRFEKGRMETIFEPNEAKYIFAITTDGAGNIYLGTGPEGKIYKLDSFGKKPQLIYDTKDKNILSLAVGRDGFVYAGSDSRGLVYKINSRTKTATVLYDSDQQEITALLFVGNKNLYAAATSAKVARPEARFAPELRLAGRPEKQLENRESTGESNGGLKLEIANTKKQGDDKTSPVKGPAFKKDKPRQPSYIYKISPDGFVTDIFNEPAVFFCIAEQEKKLLIGTGNEAELFTVELASEEKAVVYKDEQASQITAAVVSGQDVYLGTANPAKLIKLAKAFASEGTYTSELIDASQPAKWGKLQIEADIPQGCKVMVASRSGNVKDINDTTFSDWTQLVEITEPMQLRCPVGRFCQYKLVLTSSDGSKSPIVREIAVAHAIPNLAPRIESVTANLIEAAGKTGVFKISYKTKDDNEDELIYKIDFRKAGRTNWIEIEDKIEADSFEWDGKTVEDGRYEIRVIASDERSNTVDTKLTGSRISELVVVDNTGPIIKEHSIKSDEKTVTLKLQVSDEFSVIGKLKYTVDSNAEWIAAVPDDLVYDTTNEDFTLVIEELDVGEHIIAVRVSDDVGNTTYKTFEVNISDG